ncbi:hypothetical protein [Caballeronia pedi]|uniref:hypothetical protein n=1 Tax=Caballeronia pedi TaxID=1777141 RepID=UPI0007721D9D|nr:hypothetical protein [Caballeronia pedi]
MLNKNKKRRLVRWFVDFTKGWNEELHNAIQADVLAEYRRSFPNGTDDPEGIIGRMREFYHQRMMATASLLISAASLAVALVALVVSIVALRH